MSSCVECKHFHTDPVDGSCDAFEVIPHEIWASTVGHDKLRGDEDTPVSFEQLSRKKRA